MTRIRIMDPANPARDGWHSITDTSGGLQDSLNGNIKMVFLSGIPKSLYTNNQRQPDDWSCGPYALAEALNQNGETVRQWLIQRGLISTEYGTSHSGIVSYIQACGYSCAWDGNYYNGQMNPSVYQELINHLRNRYKAILLMGGRNSNAGGPCRNSYWSNAGHFVCAYDIDGGTTTGGDKFMFELSQIQYGSQGVDVLLLQEILKAREIYNGELDRSFGPQLEAAVRTYQQYINAHGGNLAVDGICGPATWSSMLGKANLA